jgi:hypothetical protein
MAYTVASTAEQDAAIQNALAKPNVRAQLIIDGLTLDAAGIAQKLFNVSVKGLVDEMNGERQQLRYAKLTDPANAPLLAQVDALPTPVAKVGP